MLDLADELKAKQQEREPHRLLEGRTVGLLFRKHSTRTRVSLEVACAHLGATAIYLPGDQLQLARGESVGTRRASSPATSTRSRSGPMRTARWTSSLRPPRFRS